jgi:hypothetical protein
MHSVLRSWVECVVWVVDLSVVCEFCSLHDLGLENSSHGVQPYTFAVGLISSVLLQRLPHSLLSWTCKARLHFPPCQGPADSSSSHPHAHSLLLTEFPE